MDSERNDFVQLNQLVILVLTTFFFFFFRIHYSVVSIWLTTNRGRAIIRERQFIITLSLEVLPTKTLITVPRALILGMPSSSMSFWSFQGLVLDSDYVVKKLLEWV